MGSLRFRALLSLTCASISSTLAAEPTFPCPDAEIVRYSALRTPEPPVIDGKLDEAV